MKRETLNRITFGAAEHLVARYAGLLDAAGKDTARETRFTRGGGRGRSSAPTAPNAPRSSDPAPAIAAPPLRRARPRSTDAQTPSGSPRRTPRSRASPSGHSPPPSRASSAGLAPR